MSDYSSNNFNLLLGDSLVRLDGLVENSVDSIVCDPPYHLSSIVKRFGKSDSAPAKVKETGVYARSSKGFMGKEWDGGDIAFTPKIWAKCLRVLKPGGHLVAFSHSRTYHHMAVAIEQAGFEIRDQIMWLYGTGFPKSHKQAGGWGTALKPAHEPMALARKPFKGSVASNMEKWGTGGINIDASRVGERFPANVIHDGLDEEWAKYFYCAKASKTDRGIFNNHPTVKPQELMTYLCKLVTPENGLILDPFLGSGSTGVAAVTNGFKFIGIEQDVDYFTTAMFRIDGAGK